MRDETPRNLTLLRVPASPSSEQTGPASLEFAPGEDAVLGAIWDADLSARAHLEGRDADLRARLAQRLGELRAGGVAWSTLHDVATCLPSWTRRDVQVLLRESMYVVEAWASRAAPLEVMRVVVAFPSATVRVPLLRFAFRPMGEDAAELIVRHCPEWAAFCLECVDLDADAGAVLARAARDHAG